MATEERTRRLDRVLSYRQPDLTVLAENLHKPRNFSAIVRTCDAVGVNELHVIPGDDGHSIHWKTSQGAEKWVKIRSHDSLSGGCAFLRGQGFRLVAAHPSGGARDYRELDYTGPVALVVGTELFGVSEAALAEADQQVMIPMFGVTRSLNVSVACAIILYEAMRQRQTAGLYDSRHLDGARWKNQRFEWLHPQLAEYCRRRKLEFPDLDQEGNLLTPLPRGDGRK